MTSRAGQFQISNTKYQIKVLNLVFGTWNLVFFPTRNTSSLAHPTDRTGPPRFALTHHDQPVPDTTLFVGGFPHVLLVHKGPSQ